MFTVRLVCVGKLKETYWREAVAEYEKRLRPFCKFEIRELPEERGLPILLPPKFKPPLEREGEAILKQSAGQLIPLCIEGKQTGSEGFARRLSAAMQSPGAVTLAIGSSYGLSPHVKQAGGGTFHVRDDLSAPTGSGNALRAAIPGISDLEPYQIPQVRDSISAAAFRIRKCLSCPERGNSGLFLPQRRR